MEYRQLVKKLRSYDHRFEVYTRRGKGSHRMISHPDIDGSRWSHPVPYHGKKTNIPQGILKDMARRFKLPPGVITPNGAKTEPHHVQNEE